MRGMFLAVLIAASSPAFSDPVTQLRNQAIYNASQFLVSASECQILNHPAVDEMTSALRNFIVHRSKALTTRELEHRISDMVIQLMGTGGTSPCDAQRAMGTIERIRELKRLLDDM